MLLTRQLEPRLNLVDNASLLLTLLGLTESISSLIPQTLLVWKQRQN